MLYLVSCGLNNSVPLPNSGSNKVFGTNTDNEKIIGRWNMCSTYGNGVFTQTNMCPVVHFKPFGIGTVESPANGLEFLFWHLKANELTISYSNKNNYSTFSDSLFYIVISKQHDKIELSITQPDNSSSYILYR
jgi:hypothetical protein